MGQLDTFAHDLLFHSRPKDRTAEDIQLIYEELLHVKAFNHLSNAVRETHMYRASVLIPSLPPSLQIKEELAAVVFLENHPVAGKYR